jgi:hypothetical protein
MNLVGHVIQISQSQIGTSGSEEGLEVLVSNRPVNQCIFENVWAISRNGPGYL